MDAEAAMDFILQRTDIDKKRIFLFGRSLGGAVSIHLAAQPYYSHHLAGLILENTFTSLPDIGRKIFDFKILDLLPEWCFKNKVSASIENILYYNTIVLYTTEGRQNTAFAWPLYSSLSKSLQSKILLLI